MTAGTLPAPGSRLGPCTTPCLHADCIQTRRMSERLCAFCELAIGYDVPFHQGPDRTLVHAICAEQAVERGEPDDYRDIKVSRVKTWDGGSHALLICGCSVRRPFRKRPVAVAHECVATDCAQEVKQ